MLRVILFVSVVSVVCGGCNSISSTLLNRTDNDVFVGNSNGETGIHCEVRPFKGIPITVRVPTHLDVQIVETIYLRKVGAAPGAGVLTHVHTKYRNLSVVPTIVETEKVFTVDPKRPAAGTLGTTITMGGKGPPDNSQYFASVGYKITDNTIKDINTALGTLLTPLPKAKNTSGGDTDTLAEELIEETRTVAWKRFDLDACDFEQQVMDFVSLHMNGCNTCEGYGNFNNPVDATTELTPKPAPASAPAPKPAPASAPAPKVPPAPKLPSEPAPSSASLRPYLPGLGNSPAFLR